mmetsp:Transcript_14162/g.36168  ORF Transcript_14162/g.36168 Transcript_14162/m.36168 type:complete len:214 (+) Transcript_14162:82-723(+)
MKLNIANPKNGAQKIIEIENENDLRIFFDKKITNEIDVSTLGEEWKGFVLKITGGQDKQGFPMKEGVLTNKRVKLLLSKGVSGCRGFGMKKGEKVRKSVRGCFVSPEIAVLNLSIIKEGKEITGLTDMKIESKTGPKRASKIRKLFRLSKGNDLRKYIIQNNKNEKKPSQKIQRMITPLSLQRKRFFHSIKKKKIISTKNKLQEYGKMLFLNN